eukprot:scaffold769_cov178-Ochromonas_danica.AAC.1
MEELWAWNREGTLCHEKVGMLRERWLRESLVSRVMRKEVLSSSSSPDPHSSTSPAAMGELEERSVAPVQETVPSY